MTVGWTKTGELVVPGIQVEPMIAAGRAQSRVVVEHKAAGGDYTAAGSQFAMLTVTIREWWLLSAVNSIYAEAPMRRCSWCRTWFTLQGRRIDAGYCRDLHRNYAAQKLKIPQGHTWADLV
jgi:hypothetical protein